jgi:hypothetical protein
MWLKKNIAGQKKVLYMTNKNTETNNYTHKTPKRQIWGPDKNDAAP